MSTAMFLSLCEEVRPYINRQSTVMRQQSRRKVSQAVSEHMGPKLNCLPKTETEVKEKVTKFFNHWLFPQCLGAVDGTHIDIKQPSYNSTDFIN